MPMEEAPTTVRVRVELFGTPRLRAGAQECELELPGEADRRLVARALAEACPALVGAGVKEDLTDLQEGYVFNLNGVAFLGSESFHLEPGDSLLLISSQAGG